MKFGEGALGMPPFQILEVFNFVSQRLQQMEGCWGDLSPHTRAYDDGFCWYVLQGMLSSKAERTQPGLILEGNMLHLQWCPSGVSCDLSMFSMGFRLAAHVHFPREETARQPEQIFC